VEGVLGVIYRHMLPTTDGNGWACHEDGTAANETNNITERKREAICDLSARR